MLGKKKKDTKHWHVLASIGKVQKFPQTEKFGGKAVQGQQNNLEVKESVIEFWTVADPCFEVGSAFEARLLR